jgi:hypothetical protein
MTYNSVVSADSPKHYVTFDQSGTLTDSGSQGATLSTTNAGTKTAPGIGGSGNYMSFNGTSNGVGINSGYDFSAGTAWSFEAWFNTTNTTATKEMIRRDGNGRAYLLRVTGQNIEWYCNGGTEILTSGTNYADGKWHHAVGTYSSGTIKLYIDGVQYGTTGTGVAGTTGTTTIAIGWDGGTSEYFNGKLDEIAIYSVALTQTQVTAHYNAGVISVTTTPPPIDFGTSALSAVVPSFAGPIDKTIAPGPMGMGDLTDPAPTITAGTGVTITPPAATMSMETPAPVVLVSVTAFETSDSAGGSNITVNVGTSTQSTLTYVNFATPTLPTGKVLSSATLQFQFNNATNGYTVHFGRRTSTASIASMTDTHDYVVSSVTTGTYYSVDVTNIINAWIGGATNDGIGISKETTGTTGPIVLVGSGGGTTSEMKITYNYTDAPPPVVITPPAMTLSLDTGVSAPVVSTTSTATINPPAQGLTLSFPGGITANPDYLALPPAMTMDLSAPNAQPSIQYPITVSAVPMELSIDTPSGVTVDLTTNRVEFPPAMTMNLNMVGIYDAAHDRYINKIITTVTGPDIWYKLDDPSGTRAIDSISGDASSSSNWIQSGYYWGTPTFLVDGPQLRRAVRFNGTTDLLTVGPYNIDNKYALTPPNGINDVTVGMSATIEFSIRTTQTDGGVVFNAAGNGIGDTGLPIGTGCKVTIEGGQLVMHEGSYSTKVRKFIADGQWHHIVIGIPDTGVNSNTMGLGTPHYVAIDGHTTLARFGSFASFGHLSGESWLPLAFMADGGIQTINFATGAPTAVTASSYLAGDLSEVIVRLNEYIHPEDVSIIYYEWSDATVIVPPPMELTVSAVDPFKAKGNTKKILAIYGLPWDMVQGKPLFTYISSLSGLVIDNVSHWAHAKTLPTTTGGLVDYPKPLPYLLDDYLVVPVSIVGDSIFDGTSPSSADGVLNSDATTMDGRFVDDETGLYRFINLQNDLAANVVDEYDVITVVNYPWENQFDPNSGNPNVTLIPEQGGEFINNTLWRAARDNFRDSLLQAAYDGANLWIGEYEMAYHLGFIQGYDIHDPAHFGFNFAGNKAGWELDRANHVHTVDDDPIGPYPFTGMSLSNPPQNLGYQAYPQANWYRRIVNLIPGLTDIPCNEIGDYVEGWNANDFIPHTSFVAYNIVRRPSGLQLGDRVMMSAVFRQSKYYGETGGGFGIAGNPKSHVNIVSAHPDGIAGTIVAREQDTYYGVDGVVIENPYKDNVTTIAAEIGTVVRGRPIGGRAFIELMDTNVGRGSLPQDADKSYTNGSPTGVIKNFWDFDTRRSLEAKVTITQSKFLFNPSTGNLEQQTTSWSYITFGGASPLIGNPAISMQSRGINWLGQKPELEPGDARAFASAIEVGLSMPNPALDNTAAPTIEVLGTMRLDLEMEEPANFASGNKTVRVLPAGMNLEMRGLGSNNAVPPITLSLATPNPTLNVAADLVTVYLDEDRNITVFLKEDN